MLHLKVSNGHIRVKFVCPKTDFMGSVNEDSMRTREERTTSERTTVFDGIGMDEVCVKKATVTWHPFDFFRE